MGIDASIISASIKRSDDITTRRRIIPECRIQIAGCIIPEYGSPIERSGISFSYESIDAEKYSHRDEEDTHDL